MKQSWRCIASTNMMRETGSLGSPGVVGEKCKKELPGCLAPFYIAWGPQL